MNPDDLAPGDAKSAAVDWTSFDLHRIRSTDEAHFRQAFEILWDEFGEPDEMEQRDVIAARLARNCTQAVGGFFLQYELCLVTKDGEWVGVRDHTAICSENPARAVVHMSHNLVRKEFRRSGIAGWLRALPVNLARRTLESVGLEKSGPVTLVGEMEPADDSIPARTIRLTAYGKAGYKKVDPSVVPYLQPDFRPADEIDESGGPQPIPLQLLVRRVGHESESSISGAEVRCIVESLYAMYGAEFRADVMESVTATLKNYPADDAGIALLDPMHGVSPLS